YTYNWSGPLGFTSNIKDVNNIIAGNYSVAVTDTNGCIGTATINITEPPSALTGTISVGNVPCAGLATGSISIAVSGGIPGYIYWWRGPGLYTSPNQTNTGLFAGPYDVVVTDTNGCQLSIDTVIKEPKAIALTYTTTNPVCKGVANGSISTSLTGGQIPFSYSWSNGATTPTVSNLGAGTYTLVYSDSNGCTDTSKITITEPLQTLVVTKDINGIKCFGDTNGVISLFTTGGTAPYTYQWSTGAQTSSISNLAQGIYIATIKDSIGCVKNDTIVLNQPDSLYLTIYSPLQFDGHNITFANGNDGSIDLTVNGGTSPFSYNWSNGATTQDLFNLGAGLYNVVVIDTNGCRATASIVLTEPFVLSMPQGFSPNNDNKNDFFVIHGIEAYPDNKL
ncbi:MAG TPA: hypothetical protein PLC65_18715, partial [Bacteroidia bacterium]|nr:hypothetical protein [Bacteroidia bacterium]